MKKKIRFDKIEKVELTEEEKKLLEIKEKSIKALRFKKIDGGWSVSAKSKAKNMTQIVIPEIYKEKPVVEIGDNAFSGYYSLTEVIIPNSVEVLGDKVFENCSSLTSATIPDSVKVLGSSAFCNCSG